MRPLTRLGAALAALLMITAPGINQAGANPVPNRSSAQIYGWSPDGRYVAFVQTSRLDASSGEVYNQLSIVDSATNTLLENYEVGSGPPDAQATDEELYSSTLNRVLGQADQRLTGLRISPDRPGTVLWKSAFPKSRIINRPASLADKQQTFMVKARGQDWTFRLSTYDIDVNDDCPFNGNPYPVRGLVLTVSAVVPPGMSVITTLQKDSAKLPRSRMCAEMYWPTEVRVQGNYMSVLLAVTHPSGSNGFNTVKYMLVTGVRPTR